MALFQDNERAERTVFKLVDVFVAANGYVKNRARGGSILFEAITFNDDLRGKADNSE